MKQFKKKKKSKKANKFDINIPPKNPEVQNVPQSLKEFIKLKSLAIETTNVFHNIKHKNLNTSFATQKKSDSSINISDNTKKNISENDVTQLPFVKNKRKKKLLKLKIKKKNKHKQLEEKRCEERNAKNELLKDDIRFGEVVHRPPQLSTLPQKVTKTGFENRPGRKDDLLLKSLLKKSVKNSDIFRLSQNRTPKIINVSDKRQLELEKQRVILAYKNMKKKSK